MHIYYDAARVSSGIHDASAIDNQPIHHGIPRKAMNIFRPRLFAWSAMASVLLLNGCSSTYLATSAAPATITEKKIKLESSPRHWGINKLYRIGNIELGRFGPRGARPEAENLGVKYTVDAGPVEIFAWYYNNASGTYKINQTGIAKMIATLKPNGRYELGSITMTNQLRFILVDTDSGATVAQSDWIDIRAQAFPEQVGLQTVPVFPGHFHLWK